MPATKLKSKKLKHPDGGASDTSDKRQKILDKVPKPPQPKPKAPQPKPSASLVTCNHCGRDRHKTAECKKSNFLIGTDRTKWYNNDPAIPYAQSKEGKDLLAKKSKYYIPKECKYLHNNHDDLIMNLDSSTNSIHTKFSPLTFVVSLNAFNGASKEVRAFADSGATSGSYASNEVAEWLADNGTVSCMCDRVICGAVGSKRCVHASCCHELNVTLHPDKNVNTLIKKQTIDIDVAILPLQYDIVIGLPTFRKHGLFQVLAPLLNGELNVSLPDSVPETEVIKPEVDSKDARGVPTLCSWTAPVTTSASLSVDTQYQSTRLLGRVSNEIPPDTVSSVTPPCGIFSGSAMLRASVKQNTSDSDTKIFKTQIWVEPESWSSIVDNKSDVIDVPGWLTSEEIECLPPNLPTKIWGTISQRQQLVALCKRHSSVFSRTISTQAALVPPMSMVVDEEKWFTKGNQLPPRTMNSTKQMEIERKTAELVDQNVIRPCLASAWSQVHLVTRPDGKYRFTCDFRRLNDCTQSQSWPIPNINEMIDRLGAKRPGYFGILDLKDGYFQAPLSADCSDYTAFTTFAGNFKYNRVAIGLRNAVAYFQNMMVTVIFVALIYKILEVYLDDVIVHDESEGFGKFITNLGLTLERMEIAKLLANPDKTVLGVPQTEYVGHTIDGEGKHFSRKKLDRVLDLDLPIYGKGLKSFLGVANWFCSHVNNFSSKTRILQEYVRDYEHTKSRKIPWTKEGIEAFENIKKEINECPKLFFYDPTLPLFLNTDASDYGIGGYLYQIDRNGKEIPLGYMSRALNKTQMGWSTFEKEGYAIYAAVMKFYHLLGDKHFTIKTDHKNLTYIRDTGSPKVMNWKHELMQFDFDILYLEGDKNVVADAWSRLLRVDENELREAKGLAPKGAESLNHMWEDIEYDNKHTSFPRTGQLTEHFASIREVAVERLANIRHEQRLPLPRDIYQWIAEVHGEMLGHCGAELTRTRLVAKGHIWDGMRAHIKQYIKECSCCQKMSQIKVAVHAAPFTLATYGPMQKISMDTIGPLTEDESGSKYVLVIIDHFTRWVELYATKTVSAEEATPLLLSYFGRYGFAEHVSTDGGTQFCNELIQSLFKAVGSFHIQCTPHSKEEMGMVERENKEVLRHLRTLIYERNSLKKWSPIYLPLTQRLVNSMVKKSTGVSPAALLFGNALDLDRRVLLDETQLVATPEKPLSKYVSDMIKAQSELILSAQALQSENDIYSVARKSLSGRTTEYPVNSFVLESFPDGAPTKGSTLGKLYPPLAGPFRVVKHIGAQYTLANLLTGKTHKVHVSRLREFLYDPAITTPVEAAKRDDHQYTVEKILNHRGVATKKTEMMFLVRWAGCGRAEDTWEPWQELRLVEALHAYLRTVGLHRMIPKNLSK